MDSPQMQTFGPWDEETARKQQAALQYASIMERPLNPNRTQARYQYYNKYDDDYGEDFSLEAPEPKEYKPKPRKLEKHSSLDYEVADLEELGLTQGGIRTRVRKPLREYPTYEENNDYYSDYNSYPNYGYQSPRLGRKSRPGSAIPMIEPGEPIRVLSVTPEVDEPIRRSEAAFLQVEDPLCC